MNAHSTLRPSASSPSSVDGPSAMISPSATRSPTRTSGRWLMQVRLVGAHELAQPVDVDALGGAVLVGRAHHDARAVDLIDHAGAAGDDGGARVARHRRLHAGADQRRIGLDQRHRLALHVGAHQRAVGVVVLQERDQRRRDRDELLRRHVDRGHVLRLHQPEVALLAHRDQFLGEAARRRPSARRPAPPPASPPPWRRDSSQPSCTTPSLHQPVRRLDEAVFVDLGVGGERVDQADIRPFRRLDRADAAVMRRMHVAHLEAGALARQTARTECREAALVRHLRQRVGLVHELRELRGAEELPHRRRRRLGVDQVVRHHGVDIDGAHALADRALHAQQADAVLVLHQLADRAHAAVAEIVDVVDLAAAVLQLAQDLHGAQDVLLAQHAHACPRHRGRAACSSSRGRPPRGRSGRSRRTGRGTAPRPSPASAARPGA